MEYGAITRGVCPIRGISALVPNNITAMESCESHVTAHPGVRISFIRSTSPYSIMESLPDKTKWIV